MVDLVVEGTVKTQYYCCQNSLTANSAYLNQLGKPGTTSYLHDKVLKYGNKLEESINSLFTGLSGGGALGGDIMVAFKNALQVIYILYTNLHN